MSKNLIIWKFEDVLIEMTHPILNKSRADNLVTNQLISKEII